MALKGSMRDFGISEILQMIGHQKKTGTLTVRDKTRTVDILIDQGNIVGAKHEPFEQNYDLSSLLVGSGLVSKSQMDMAQKEQAENLKPLEQVLLASKALSLEDLKAAVMLRCLEILYSLFLWKGGDYSFEAGPVSYPQQWTTLISSEQVLMDGYRIKDEWPEIIKVIPDGNVILQKTQEGTPPGLNDDQARILRLVDGEKTADQIVVRSREARFETLKVLKELVEAGLVEVAGMVEGPASHDFVALGLQAAAAVIVAIGLILAFSGLSGEIKRVSANGTDPAYAAYAKTEAGYIQDRAASNLELYALMNGSFPPSLSVLTQNGMLSTSDLETAWGPLSYQVKDEGETCILSAPLPGPDSAGGG